MKEFKFIFFEFFRFHFFVFKVKNVSELSSTTHHYYNADSCHEERQAKDMSMETCNNDSDEDVIVDDDDSIRISSYNKKRKYEEATVGSSR